MCEPVTISLLAATAISGGVAAYGAHQEGVAAKQQADYQAAVAKNNSILAQRAADDARARGGIEASQQRLKTLQLIGSQRASAAARGVLVDSGSAAYQIADTAAMGELDALTIRNNAEREALGFEAQGANFQGEQRLLKATGKNAVTASNYKVGATLLNSASTTGSQYAQYKSVGMIR